MIKLKLHLLMAQTRMSQKELSNLTGIQPSIINKYYNDTIVRIPKEHLNIFCKLFNCNVQDLIEYIPDEETSADTSK